MDRERRVRIVRVEERLVLDVLNFANQGPGYTLGLACFDLPSDVTIERVGHNFCLRAWELLVSHPSFDEVPDGCEAPVHNRQLARSVFYRQAELPAVKLQSLDGKSPDHRIPWPPAEGDVLGKLLPGEVVCEGKVETRDDGSMVAIEKFRQVGKVNEAGVIEPLAELEPPVAAAEDPDAGLSSREYFEKKMRG